MNETGVGTPCWKEKREKEEKKKGGREREKRGEKKEDVILITNHFALGIQEGLCYTHTSAITMRVRVRFTQSEDKLIKLIVFKLLEQFKTFAM